MSVSIETITGKTVTVDSNRQNVTVHLFERDGNGGVVKNTATLDIEAASVLIETLKVYTAKAKSSRR